MPAATAMTKSKAVTLAATAVIATATLSLLPTVVDAHGHITVPPARNNGTVEKAGNCDDYACVWFSQITEIPGQPTLPDDARTFNLGVSSGPDDWSRKNPWRAPGTAPVYGSGCGAAGGGPIPCVALCCSLVVAYEMVASPVFVVLVVVSVLRACAWRRCHSRVCGRVCLL
jgi:hypothetical protein